MELSYILNELGEDRELYFNAVSPPIMQTSNFAFKTVAAFRAALADEYQGNLYSRGFNPTSDILRKKLAALDNAEDALVFSSGIAAITVPILSLLKQGDHVICVENPYSWTTRLFTDFLPKFGIECSFVDGTENDAFRNAVKPETRLIFLESPNTFSFDVQDLAAVAELARGAGILTMIDNSYCSPLYQKPADYGIDLVAQSATKYLSGHSDVVAGVLSGKKSLLEKIFVHEYMNIGTALAPQNAWLLLRGLRTLEIRLERISATAAKVIRFLEDHPKVAKVLHPFSAHSKQEALARRQMRNSGGLFSFILKDGTLENIERCCNGLQHILMAVSWGGHESLVMPACAGIAAGSFDAENERHKLIRLYVGLEDAEYLIADLEQALA